ncbi:MAG: hypothetical protein ACR2PI_22485 [Hyphomicrobiaceae bacterium]
MGHFLKAVVITLLGFAAIGVTTWGLLTKDIDPEGFMMAVVGLVAYLVVWMVALFLIRPTPPA